MGDGAAGMHIRPRITTAREAIATGIEPFTFVWIPSAAGVLPSVGMFESVTSRNVTHRRPGRGRRGEHYEELFVDFTAALWRGRLARGISVNLGCWWVGRNLISGYLGVVHDVCYLPAFRDGTVLYLRFCVNACRHRPEAGRCGRKVTGQKNARLCDRAGRVDLWLP